MRGREREKERERERERERGREEHPDRQIDREKYKHIMHKLFISIYMYLSMYVIYNLLKKSQLKHMYYIKIPTVRFTGLVRPDPQGELYVYMYAAVSMYVSI